MATTPQPNAFDRRRQQIKSDEEREKSRSRERVTTQRASQGTSGGGIENRQQRLQEASIRETGARQRGLVDIEELQKQERVEAAEKERAFIAAQGQEGRTFQSGESALSRALAKEQFGGSQDIARQQLSQQKEQFGAGQELTREQLAQQQGQFADTLGQQQAQFTGGQELTREQLAQQQGQFSAGLEQAGGQFEQQLALSQQAQDQGFQLAQQGVSLQEAALQLEAQGMDQQQAQFFASLGQADAQFTAGLSLQENAQALQAKGMDQADAQFFASLNQTKDLADKGFSLEQIKLDMAKDGQNIQNNQFMLGLDQAKTLADRGFSIDQISQDLQRQGLSQNASQFSAQLAAQTSENEANRDQQITLLGLESLNQQEILNLQNNLFQANIRLEDVIFDENQVVDQNTQIKNLLLAESISSLNPESPDFQAKLQNLASQLGFDVPVIEEDLAPQQVQQSADKAASGSSKNIVTSGFGAIKSLF